MVQTADFMAQHCKRYFVTHGNQFETAVMNAKRRAHWGDRAYELLFWLSPKAHRIRSMERKLLIPVEVGETAGQARGQFIGADADVLAEEARRGGYNGVICGHIHHAISAKSARSPM